MALGCLADLEKYMSVLPDLHASDTSAIPLFTGLGHDKWSQEHCAIGNVKHASLVGRSQSWICIGCKAHLSRPE